MSPSVGAREWGQPAGPEGEGERLALLAEPPLPSVTHLEKGRWQCLLRGHAGQWASQLAGPIPGQGSAPAGRHLLWAGGALWGDRSSFHNPSSPVPSEQGQRWGGRGGGGGLRGRVPSFGLHRAFGWLSAPSLLRVPAPQQQRGSSSPSSPLRPPHPTIRCGAEAQDPPCPRGVTGCARPWHTRGWVRIWAAASRAWEPG